MTRPTLKASSLSVMNFLNEIVASFPDAISFAPGRPIESHFGVEASLAEIDRYVSYRMSQTGRPRDAVYAELGQYGRTKGIIADLIASHLALDEKITADPESIIVTNGAQEAMTIVLLGMIERTTDVLLVSEPNYIGITGMAALLDLEVVPVSAGADGTDPAELERVARDVSGRGKRVAAFYDIPDFHNPLGVRMPVRARRRIIELATELGFSIIEDNPYGMYAYDDERLPTLRALSGGAPVIYIGTLSKTVFPGLRIGYLVANGREQADELSKVKSLTTVNTAPLLQAVAGGVLLAGGGSLVERCRPNVEWCKHNRDRMLERLEHHFGADPVLRDRVSWNRPAGGFFLTMTLPFEFDDEHLQRCARDHRVIVCPMSFFSPKAERRRQIRLSFSYVSSEQIDLGIARLFEFVSDVMRPPS
jgi:(S)-3,5-dihydroxyphenylglycine transaminase